MNPSAQIPVRPRAIQDVLPPADSLGNPQAPAPIPVRQAPEARSVNNPIAGSGPLPEAAPSPGKTQELERVLKDVSKDVRLAAQKPQRRSKPTLAIAAAVIMALVLSVAAFFALKKN